MALSFKDITDEIGFIDSSGQSNKTQKPVHFTVENKQRLSSTLQSSNLTKQIHLSSKSRTFLILRILLLCLCCIYIPMEVIVHSKLQDIEDRYIVNHWTKMISSETKMTSLYYYMNYGLTELIAGRETIPVYISLIYIFHPFIALKLVFIVNLIYYCITILQCLYQYRRPFWLETPSADLINPFCISSYASPTENLFFVTFIYLYGFVSIRLVHKKQNLSVIKKIIVIIPYIVFITFISVMLMINKINYIYQIIYAWSISLLLTCGLMDMDNMIHNFIFRALKNIFKTRKYKMKIFFYVLSLTLLSVLVYFYVPYDNLNKVEDNLYKNPYCFYTNIEELGLKRTYLNISYVFGIIGAFWGASFTVERDCGKWWKGTKLNLFIKMIVTIAVCVIISLIFSYADYFTYELRFIIFCLKHLANYYCVMGLLPFVFDLLKMNEREDSIQHAIGVLFKKTIFSENKLIPIKDDSGIINTSSLNTSLIPSNKDNSEINESSLNDKTKTVSDMDIEDDTELLTKHKDETIFKKSTIVNNVQKHSGDERYEFTVKDEYQNDQLFLTFKKEVIEEEGEGEGDENAEQ